MKGILRAIQGEECYDASTGGNTDHLSIGKGMMCKIIIITCDCYNYRLGFGARGFPFPA